MDPRSRRLVLRAVKQLRGQPPPPAAMRRALARVRRIARPASPWLRALLRGTTSLN